MSGQFVYFYNRKVGNASGGTEMVGKVITSGTKCSLVFTQFDLKRRLVRSSDILRPATLDEKRTFFQCRLRDLRYKADQVNQEADEIEAQLEDLRQ